MNTLSIHTCKQCGCYWRRWEDGTWSLADARQKCEPCCDNTPDFLRHLDPPALDAVDAARYRWLREHSCQTDSAGNDAESWSTHSDPASLDAMIDAELAKQR